MPLRAKIILSVIIGIVGITLIIAIVAGVRGFFNRPQSSEQIKQTEQTNSEQQSGNDSGLPSLTGESTSTNTAPVPDPNPPKQLDKTQDTLVTLAVPFVERFGTYSNQSNFDNLTSLLPFMTPAMQSWAQEKIDKAQKEAFNPLYTGTTTKALSYSITSVSDGAFEGSAEIKVETQRKESVGSPANAKVYNQDIIVKLVKRGDVWLIDSATWQ